MSSTRTFVSTAQRGRRVAAPAATQRGLSGSRSSDELNSNLRLHRTAGETRCGARRNAKGAPALRLHRTAGETRNGYAVAQRGLRGSNWSHELNYRHSIPQSPLRSQTSSARGSPTSWERRRSSPLLSQTSSARASPTSWERRKAAARPDSVGGMITQNPGGARLHAWVTGR